MSRTDEMFERLGYKKISTPSCFIYQDKENNKEIRFWKTPVESIEFSLIDTEYKAKSIFFTMQELETINEKCKELRWLE